MDQRKIHRPDGQRSTTREDMRKLQVMQNKVEKIIYARLNNITMKEIDQMPTRDLLEKNNVLSMHQMGAQSILTLIKKIIATNKPTQLSRQLSRKTGRSGTTWKTTRNPKLNITTSNFIHKGVRLWNMLDEELKTTISMKTFKDKMKKWVKINTPLKPD